MHPLPNECPLTGGPIIVTRFICPESGLTIEGEFVVNTPFAQLTADQIQFIEAFVRNEGKLNRMEEELNLSYPTIRARLRDIIRAMGHEPGKDEAPEESPIYQPETRQTILQRLHNGEIDFESAMAQLRGE